MNQAPFRERVKTRTQQKTAPKRRPVRYGVLQFDQEETQQESPPQPQTRPQQPQPQSRQAALRPSSRVPVRREYSHAEQAQRQVQRTKHRLAKQQSSQRFPRSAKASRGRQHEDERIQHELHELQETEDLREVDDDVEDVATLYEWHALEHNHQPKTPVWYAVLAAGITVVSVGFLLFGNIIAAITIAFVGGMVYYIAQKDPATFRYRIMTEGVAFNNTLYHYRDLDAFNIVYEPGETKTVLLRSNRTFSPLLHMEIGEADPVEIRDFLIEFVREDQDLEEPLVDIWARRLGF